MTIMCLKRGGLFKISWHSLETERLDFVVGFPASLFGISRVLFSARRSAVLTEVTDVFFSASPDKF